jgi:hypothetical protein
MKTKPNIEEDAVGVFSQPSMEKKLMASGSVPLIVDMKIHSPGATLHSQSPALPGTRNDWTISMAIRIASTWGRDLGKWNDAICDGTPASSPQATICEVNSSAQSEPFN